MPTAKKTSVEKTGEEKEAKTLTIQVPTLSALKTTNLTPLLVGLLVVAAFIIGVLFTKISYLEKGQSGTSGTGAQASPAASAAVPGAKVDVGLGKLPVLGNKDAKVKVIEFADYQCPFCEQ